MSLLARLVQLTDLLGAPRFVTCLAQLTVQERINLSSQHRIEFELDVLVTGREISLADDYTLRRVRLIRHDASVPTTILDLFGPRLVAR